MMFDNKDALKKEMEEIRLLIRYAVPVEEHTSACNYLESFHEDQFALL